MSIWLEIHCDVRAGGMLDPLTARCSSYRNDNPCGMAKNISAIRMTLLGIESAAAASGWRHIRGKWICPGCAQIAPALAKENGNDK